MQRYTYYSYIFQSEEWISGDAIIGQVRVVQIHFVQVRESESGKRSVRNTAEWIILESDMSSIWCYINYRNLCLEPWSMKSMIIVEAS